MSELGRESETALHRPVVLMGILQGGAFAQRGAGLTTGRVAQDVNQQGLVDGQQVLGARQDVLVQHVCLQRLCLVVGAVHQQRHGDGAQGVVASEHIGCLPGCQDVHTLALIIEMYGVAVCGVDHAVLDGHHATRKPDDVGGVALGVVVIIIPFGSGNLHGIGAHDIKDGMSEGVHRLEGVLLVGGPALLPDRIAERHLDTLARHILGGVGLVAEVVELVIADLLIVEDDGRVVDAGVLGVVLLDDLRHATAGGIGPVACQLVAVQRERVGEVNDVVDHAVLEQGGVAFGRYLLDLPLHGWQPDDVLAGMDVGLHHHAVLGGVDARLVEEYLVMAIVQIDGVALLTGIVLNVPYQPRHIIALQREHHLQVVAQVVAAERVVERQRGLHVTAGHAADEFYAGVVIEVDAGLVGLEVVLRVLLVALVGVVIAFVVEPVTVLHSLDGVAAGQHTEGELPLMVALDRAGAAMDLDAIDEEGDALDGDARTVVLDVAGEQRKLRRGHCRYSGSASCRPDRVRQYASAGSPWYGHPPPQSRCQRGKI